MCGIIGIIDREVAAPQLIDALARPEYRGYDSSGVATLENGKLTRRSAEGKLKNLESRLEREPLKGTIGIGHTRWATHGRPTENNAHPHATRKSRGARSQARTDRARRREHAGDSDRAARQCVREDVFEHAGSRRPRRAAHRDNGWRRGARLRHSCDGYAYRVPTVHSATGV